MADRVLVAGIDEAGRGAVIGPLVIAGVSADERTANSLKKMGVRDSKLLTPKKREVLAEKIEGVAKDIAVIKVGPCKIDSHIKGGVNLNKIEAMRMADITNFLKPHRMFIDCPERNLEKFNRFVSSMVRCEPMPEMITENKADVRYPIVAAASIIAKVERDREIAELCKEHGNLGSGYPSDEVTVNWLKSHLEDNGKFPDFVRRSWMTAELMEKERLQTRLGSFFKNLVSK